jgi:hypothetical protein
MRGQFRIRDWLMLASVHTSMTEQVVVDFVPCFQVGRSACQRRAPRHRLLQSQAKGPGLGTRTSAFTVPTTKQQPVQNS